MDNINAIEKELNELKQKMQSLQVGLANAKSEYANQQKQLQQEEVQSEYKGPLKSYMYKTNCFDEKQYTLFVLAFYQVDESNDYKRYDYVRQKMPEIMNKIRETIKERCPYIKSIGNACECGAFCQNMIVPNNKVHECSESLRNLIIEVKEGTNVLGNWQMFQKVLF